LDPTQTATIKLITDLLALDPTARDWWQKSFGLHSFMIPTGLFVEKFMKGLNANISSGERAVRPRHSA